MNTENPNLPLETEVARIQPYPEAHALPWSPNHVPLSMILPTFPPTAPVPSRIAVPSNHPDHTRDEKSLGSIATTNSPPWLSLTILLITLLRLY